MNCLKKDEPCEYEYCGECLPKYCQKTLDTIVRQFNDLLTKLDHINSACAVPKKQEVPVDNPLPQSKRRGRTTPGKMKFVEE